MVINVRGTSGSGKSHLVRSVMELYPSRTPEHAEGRKQPLGYVCVREGLRPLYVVGHYETPCGGGDTIPTMDIVYSLVRRGIAARYNVLYEGLVIASDTRRCIELAEMTAVAVVELSTDIRTCFEAVQQRRAERGESVEELDDATLRAAEQYRSASAIKKALQRYGTSEKITSILANMLSKKCGIESQRATFQEATKRNPMFEWKLLDRNDALEYVRVCLAAL